MKLKIAAIGLILVAACVCGCIGSNEPAITTDKYYCTVDEGILYLSSNAQYEMLIDEMYGGGGIYGNYSVRDNMILLKREFLGDIIRFTTDGRDLIDPDGDRWVRD